MYKSKKSKLVIDIILIATLLSALIFSDPTLASINQWKSMHCNILAFGSIFILIHIYQHWKLTKSLIKKKVLLRNKLTALTTFIFVVLFLTISIFLFGFPEQIMRIHNIVGHIFIGVIVLHILSKTKKFVGLFHKKIAVT